MSILFEEELEPVNSWASAVDKSKGYQASELVRDLTQQFQNSINSRLSSKGDKPTNLSTRRAHLIAGWSHMLARSIKKEITVADIGGGNGYMRDWVAQHQGVGAELNGQMSTELRIIWNVYESKEISAAYQLHKGNLPIDFIENVRTNYPKEIDFSLLSCFIQYVDDWDEVIKSLYEKSKYLLLMRVPLIPSKRHREFVQHLHSDSYGKSKASWPIRLFSEKKFMEYISEDFQIIFSGVDYEETFPFEGIQYPMRTFFLRIK